jgi:hypothetical protein
LVKPASEMIEMMPLFEKDIEAGLSSSTGVTTVMLRKDTAMIRIAIRNAKNVADLGELLGPSSGFLFWVRFWKVLPINPFFLSMDIFPLTDPPFESKGMMAYKILADCA